MKQALRIAAQLTLYVPLMAIIGCFSTKPLFSAVGPGQSLVRLSVIHAAQHKHACRQRSAEELAKLAPNMRAALDCPRERADLVVELELDGAVVLRRKVRPTGLQRDGNAALYARLPVPAGRHHIVARLRDRAEGDFNYLADKDVSLDAGGVVLIDFNANQGGFLFRS